MYYTYRCEKTVIGIGGCMAYKNQPKYCVNNLGEKCKSNYDCNAVCSNGICTHNMDMPCKKDRDCAHDLVCDTNLDVCKQRPGSDITCVEDSECAFAKNGVYCKKYWGMFYGFCTIPYGSQVKCELDFGCESSYCKDNKCDCHKYGEKCAYKECTSLACPVHGKCYSSCCSKKYRSEWTEKDKWGMQGVDYFCD